MHSSLFFIIVIIFFFFLCSKWLLFIVLSPLICNYTRRQHRNWEKNRALLADQKGNDPYSSVARQTPTPYSKLVRIKLTLVHLLRSYMRYMDIQVSFIPFMSLRVLIYKMVFGLKAKGVVTIHYGTEIRSHCNLFLGKNTIVGDKALLDARNGIMIGDNVNISSNVSIYTMQHDHRKPDFSCSTNELSSVEIGDRVWIGPNVIILPGVKIGEGAVVAAGAVVTHDILPYTINAGMPSKIIGQRNSCLNYSFEGGNSFLY